MELGVIMGNIVNLYSDLYFNFQIFVIAFWSILILILFFTVLLFVQSKQKKRKEKINLKPYLAKNKTDLDILYEILKQKKKLKIALIANSFNVKEKVVHEWGKILESGDLALVEYPTIGKPFLRLEVDLKEEKKKEFVAEKCNLSESPTHKGHKKKKIKKIKIVKHKVKQKKENKKKKPKIKFKKKSLTKIKKRQKK